MDRERGIVRIEIDSITRERVWFRIITIKDDTQTETEILGPYRADDALELSLEVQSTLIVVEHKN